MAAYSHALEELNKPLLRPRHPSRPESHINNNGVKPSFCFKATDHTIRRSKSQHHLQLSGLNSRKVDFKVSRLHHFTSWSYNGLRVGWWFNHWHDVCCFILSNKGPLTMAGKAQNTVRALYSIGQCGLANACIKFMRLLFWGAQFRNRLGVVHGYVGQKFLKPYIIRVFRLTDYELFHATFD
jgi:hypothetical protein